ncbi:DUF4307 domain-containing protein [Corynebacterium uterequi]|uniref:Putative DUF4307 family protein n=1 Tax=Corynebacterium uterequi TaxID=1072256 RepID=A0A0G3HFP5_9CORY|nr:DUF4307 domain-containing protein [Corynebacterium uterequi]AKK10768.1 putative DUF4307 family protein [Corynebacterium uterequi]
MSSSFTRPASRYGRDTSPQKRNQLSGKVFAILLAILAISLVAFIGRLVYASATKPISATYVAHERVDDATLRVWVDIERRDVNEPAYCIVTAMDYEMAEVGRREILLPAGGEAHQRIAADIPTRELPVAGQLYGCSTAMAPFMEPDQAVNTF